MTLSLWETPLGTGKQIPGGDGIPVFLRLLTRMELKDEMKTSGESPHHPHTNPASLEVTYHVAI